MRLIELSFQAIPVPDSMRDPGFRVMPNSYVLRDAEASVSAEFLCHAEFLCPAGLDAGSRLPCHAEFLCPAGLDAGSRLSCHVGFHDGDSWIPDLRQE